MALAFAEVRAYLQKRYALSLGEAATLASQFLRERKFTGELDLKKECDDLEALGGEDEG